MRALCILLLLLGVAIASNAQRPASTITLIAEGNAANPLFPYYQNEFQDQVQLRFDLDAKTGRWQPLQVAASHPLLLQLGGEGIKQYLVYAQPGDTIYLQAHPGESVYCTFHGSRARRAQDAELNFFTALERQGLGVGLPDWLGLFLNARYPFQAQRLRAKLERRLALLHRERDSLLLSPAFAEVASQQLRAQYLAVLFHPYGDKNHCFSQFPATYNDLLTAADAAAFFTSDAQVQASQCYRGAAVGYVRYLSRAALDTPEELPAMYRTAGTALPGQTRDYVRFYLLKSSMGKNLPVYSACYEQFRHDCTTPSYVRYLDSLAERPAALQQRRDLLTTPLLSSTGEKLSWAQVVARNKGKAAYFDLWASWCGPCLAEMPASAALQSTDAGQAVQFVYVSLDTDKTKWLKAIAAHKLDQPGAQHYLLDPTSKLAKFLNVPPIPRYLLLDKQGRAASLDAARPSNPLLLQDLAKLP